MRLAKCLKIVPFDVKFNALSGPGLGFSMPLIVFPQFRKEVVKNDDFFKILWFFKFNIEMWHHFEVQMCKTGYHLAAWSMLTAILVTTNWLLNYSGHRGPKTDLSTKKSKIENFPKTWPDREKRITFSDSAAQIDYKSAKTFQTILFYFSVIL